MNHMSNEAYLDAESKNVAARGLRLTISEISHICCGRVGFLSKCTENCPTTPGTLKTPDLP